MVRLLETNKLLHKWNYWEKVGCFALATKYKPYIAVRQWQPSFLPILLSTEIFFPKAGRHKGAGTGAEDTQELSWAEERVLADVGRSHGWQCQWGGTEGRPGRARSCLPGLVGSTMGMSPFHQWGSWSELSMQLSGKARPVVIHSWSQIFLCGTEVMRDGDCTWNAPIHFCKSCV